jgi:hypothetical protein
VTTSGEYARQRSVREVTQTITYSPEREAEGIYGNCLQAAVAALFDKPLDAVPHFSAFLWWEQALALWAKGEGYRVEDWDTTVIPDRLCIIGGKSPRGVPHVCVADGGRIVWDPHPSRDGLVTITSATWFVEDELYMQWKRWSDTQRRAESAEVEAEAESVHSGGTARQRNVGADG